MFSSFVRLSGATYRSFVLPFRISSFTCNICCFDSELLRKCAMFSLVLILRMASTWFFISAISGDMTIAVPSSMSEGN